MLAIAVYFEGLDGNPFTASIGTTAKDPKKLAKQLANHNENGIPDEILLVKNDLVIGHFNIGKEYDEKDIV